MGSGTDPGESLERMVLELQVDVSHLSGSFTQLSESQSKYGDRLRSVELELARSGSEVSQRLGTLERQMASMTQTLARIEASSFRPRPPGKDIASASHPHILVSDSPVAVSDDSPVGFRGSNMMLASRESLLRKIDLPVFEGHMPYGWLCRVERYFRVGQYTDAAKLELISLSLEGRVLTWFEGEQVDNPFTDWSQFKERMLARFALVKSDSPSTEFLKKESVSHSIQDADLSCEIDSITTLEKTDPLVGHDSLTSVCAFSQVIEELVVDEIVNELTDPCLSLCESGIKDMIATEMFQEEETSPAKEAPPELSPLIEVFSQLNTPSSTWINSAHHELKLISRERPNRNLQILRLFSHDHKAVEVKAGRMGQTFIIGPLASGLARSFPYSTGDQNQDDGTTGLRETCVVQADRMLLHRLRIHQKEKKRKCSKSWKFKYKEHALVVLSLQGLHRKDIEKILWLLIRENDKEEEKLQDVEANTNANERVKKKLRADEDDSKNEEECFSEDVEITMLIVVAVGELWFMHSNVLRLLKVMDMQKPLWLKEIGALDTYFMVYLLLESTIAGFILLQAERRLTLSQFVLASMMSHLMYRWSLCVDTRSMGAELQICLLAHHSPGKQTRHCLELNEFSWFKKLPEMSAVMSLQKNPEMVILLEKKTQDLNAEEALIIKGSLLFFVRNVSISLEPQNEAGPQMSLHGDAIQTQYNNLEWLNSTDRQSSSVGHKSSGCISVGGVHEFSTCSTLLVGSKTHGTRLLFQHSKSSLLVHHFPHEREERQTQVPEQLLFKEESVLLSHMKSDLLQVQQTEPEFMHARRSSCVALTAETYFLEKTSIFDAVTRGHTAQTGGQPLQGRLMLHHFRLLREHKQKQRKCVKTWMFKYKLGDKLILKGGEY